MLGEHSCDYRWNDVAPPPRNRAQLCIPYDHGSTITFACCSGLANSTKALFTPPSPASDSPLEEAGFEPSVPPVKETAVERGGSAANRRRLAKMTPSGLSVRYLPSAVETLS